MSSTFLLHHSYNKLEFSDQGCHCLLEQNQPMLWETKGKEHPLFKECCSSQREAQSSAFPSYFLSELPLGTLPALLPLCVSQTSTDLAEPHLGFWELLLCPGWMQNPCSDLRCSLRALGEAHPQGGTVISRCARPGTSTALNKHTGSSHLPRDLFWGEG